MSEFYFFLGDSDVRNLLRLDCAGEMFHGFVALTRRSVNEGNPFVYCFILRNAMLVLEFPMTPIPKTIEGVYSDQQSDKE